MVKLRRASNSLGTGIERERNYGNKTKRRQSNGGDSKAGIAREGRILPLPTRDERGHQVYMPRIPRADGGPRL